MNCLMYSNEKATVKVTYGTYGTHYNVYNLCDKAAKELYERCKGAINEQIIYWKNEPITRK